MDLMKMLDGQVALGNKSNSKNLGEHKVSRNMMSISFQFWNTQPVPQLPTASSSSVGPSEGPLDAPKTPADVKQQPGALPSGFEWSLIDVKNDTQVSDYFRSVTDV
jgi:glycylpeptide N-tetradecanoyltransferase